MKCCFALAVAALILAGCSSPEPPAAPHGSAQGSLAQAPTPPSPEIDVDSALAQRLAQLELPVVLPRTAAHRQDAFVTSGPGWASVTTHGDGLHLSVLARSRAVSYPALAASAPPCGDAECVRTARSHTITSVSFTRYGISYLLDVECERAGADPRCADEAFALQVYEDLALAGGGR